MDLQLGSGSTRVRPDAFLLALACPFTWFHDWLLDREWDHGILMDLAWAAMSH